MAGVDEPLDFLDSPQYFQQHVVELVVGGVFLAELDDVVQHFFVGVLFFDVSCIFHKPFFVLTSLCIPFVVDRKNQLLKHLQPLLALIQFVYLDLRDFLVELEIFIVADGFVLSNLKVLYLFVYLGKFCFIVVCDLLKF